MLTSKERGMSRITKAQGPDSSRREISRRDLIDRWRNAPEGIKPYPAGTAIDGQGNTYEYAVGTRLWIGDQKEVMDSCQDPWVNATVDHAFNELGLKQNVSVLERGFGMGRVATRIMQHLDLRGGDYAVIELNEKVVDYIENEWIKKMRKIAHTRAISPIGGKYTEKFTGSSDIGVEIIKGDAVEKTKELQEADRKFDIIISDTFPLSDDEREGTNDLNDLETLKKCLAQDGVFTFFGYFTGSQGGIGERQRDKIAQHFETYGIVKHVTVNPPPDYKYFQTPNGPLRRLPVIICKNPLL